MTQKQNKDFDLFLVIKHHEFVFTCMQTHLCTMKKRNNCHYFLRNYDGCTIARMCVCKKKNGEKLWCISAFWRNMPFVSKFVLIFFETQQRTSNIRTKESTCQSDPTEPSLPISKLNFQKQLKEQIQTLFQLILSSQPHRMTFWYSLP